MTAEQHKGSALGRIARNGALTATADILAKLCALAFFALLAREYGGATLGHYVFALALTSLIWSFAGFGLDRMALRDIARDPGVMRRVAVPMAALKLVGALLLTAGCAAALAVAGEEREVVVLVLLLGGNTALLMSSQTAHAVFQANERMEHVFATKVPWAIAQATVGVLVVLAGGGIVAAVAASTIGVGLLGALLSWSIVLRHYGRPELRADVRGWPGMLRRAVPFSLQEVLGQITFRFGTVVLAAVAADAVVGAYGAAYRMLEATFFIAWAIGYSVMPLFSYLPQGEELTRLYEAAIKIVLILMAPLAVAMLVCAPAIIDLLYGLPEYSGSVEALRLLAFAVAVYSVSHISGLLVLLKRPGRVTVAVSASVAVANVVTCAVLIPAFGGVGAAVAALACETLLAVVGLVLARRVTGRQRVWWVAGGPAVASVAMGLAMWPLDERLWLAVPAGAVVYVLALAACEARGIKEDLALFRTISANRPGGVRVEEPVAL
jgi:O-antigen/teichoic acid export membrane protein